MPRRRFLKQTLVLSSACVGMAWVLPRALSAPAGKRLVVGVMGLSRGMDLVRAVLDTPDVELGWVCDTDQVRLDSAMKAISNKAGRAPQTTRDFRRILEDREVDAMFIATCNHWHAPATILACQAGKHVYVEKPGSHNPYEGELSVAAARKYDRVVQQGTQRRSFPGTREGIERLQSGAIGRVTYARCWYVNSRPSIGHGKRVPVPPGLDYELWQGPAPERPYVDNLVHYQWHWRWHWGNGELGNNGIHTLDLARWGLQVDYPLAISYTGGRFHYQDDQETPDTGVVTFDFGDKGVSWEHSSCHPRKPESYPLITFYGTEGSLALDGNGYKIYDLQGKLVREGSGPGGDQVHVVDFLDAIRAHRRPNADIAEGQKSTLLCHLGNISYRVGRRLQFDPATRRIVHDREAMRFWKREYRRGWEPKV